MKQLTSLALLLLTVLTSCTKNQSATNSPGIVYQMKVGNPSAPLARQAAGTVQWTSGFAWAREIKFRAEDGSNRTEFKSEAVRKVDLFAALTTLNTVTVQPGTYRKVKFEIETAPVNGEASFQLTGQYSNGSATTPVQFVVNAPLEFETEKENITITATDTYTAVTTFDLSLLTQGITSAQLDAAIRTNGTVVLSATSNSALYQILFDRLRNCGGIEVKK